MANSASQVRAFCARPASAVLFDEPTGVLFDVPSGKSLPLDLSALRGVEERTDRTSGAKYLVLKMEGRELAITASGLAFAPIVQAGVPVTMPPAVCLRDYAELLERVKHQLYGHREQKPGRDTVEAVMMCVATLEGARAAGFDVSREERELDVHLRELERRSA